MTFLSSDVFDVFKAYIELLIKRFECDDTDMYLAKFSKDWQFAVKKLRKVVDDFYNFSLIL